MKTPDLIDLDMAEVRALLERIKTSSLPDKDCEIIKGMVETILYLDHAVNSKTTSIKRLLRMLFGAKTEKAENILKQKDENDTGAANTPSDKPEKPTKNKEKKRKGHGRNGADAYTGAERQTVSHLDLKHGDSCPLCPKGKVYEQKKPGVVFRIRGNAPISATIYELEKLRCNLCGKVFTAEAPDKSTSKKYDSTARAMMALLKYGAGFPFYRLAQLQASLGIPLPASSQWDQVEESANLIYPVFEELKRQAAQGEIIHNDDTTMKILDLLKENRDRKEKDRTGIFTTGILSIMKDHKIVLFFTGRNHAGENLSVVLNKRDSKKGPPLQMCDALSRNPSKDFETIMSHCLVHARRKFVDVMWNFPDECQYVVECIGKVYKNDEETKKQNMSPIDRLSYHQKKSASPMADLKTWLTAQIDKKLVEPNSGLGQAISYMLKYWSKFILFLKIPGAPLDNNICEQSLKRAILHRKNALFYKTEHGAYIGDLYMSIIHTCRLAKVNPFDYLVVLQKHSSDLFQNPSRWMPWNFEKTLASLTI